MHISHHAIRRPVTVMMGVLIVVILGIISLTRIPIDLYPPIEVPTVAVMTSYSGVGPEEMENLVTKPIEQAVSTVAGIKTVRSTSREGNSQVIIEFGSGVKIDSAVNEVQQKVDRAKRSLPEDVSTPTVAKFDPNSSPVLTLALSANLRADQLKNLVDQQIVPYVERVNGVASVSVSGGLEREVKILLDTQKLEQYDITIADIKQQLKNQNLDTPGGTVTEGGISYQVRSLGKLTSVDDIRKVSIPLKSGSQMFLEDLAVISEGYKDVAVENKLNGKNTVSMTIMKQTGSNTVAVVDEVNAAIAKVLPSLPADFEILHISDDSRFIRDSINTLVHDTLIGGFLAIVIILFFLRSISNTVIIGTAIPIAVISTFALMFFSDMSINTMSLGGLTLGVGMIVDDAIVVLENIHRHRENGMTIREAAVAGTKEVTMPVIAATLTTVAVFLPIVFVEGVTAQLFKDLAVTVSFSLLVSLVVSLTVTPMLATKWVGSRAKAKAKTQSGQHAHPHSHDDAGWIHVYRSMLRWSLGHRKTVVLIGLVSLIAGVGLVPFIGSEFMPSSDQGQISVSIRLPVGSELDKTREVMDQAEKMIAQVPEVNTILTSLGSANATRPANNASSESAAFHLILKDGKERTRSTAEVVENIRMKLNRFPGARVRVSEAANTLTMLGGGGGGGYSGGGSGGPIAYAIRGNDADTLQQLAGQLTAAISEVDGVRQADNTLEETRPEIQVSLDRIRAAELGVTQTLVASTIQTALKDQVATQMDTNGTQTDVTIVLGDGKATHMQDIENLLLTSTKGEKVQIKDVANVFIADGPQSIQRYNQARVVNVTAMLAPGRDLGSVTQAINKVVDTFPLPPGYVIEQQGQNQQMQESTQGMILAFVLAVVLVYIILSAQFESVVYPLSIMLSVPLSFFGASFSLWVTGRTLSVPALIGIVLLAGIVVRNAIVLIDFTNILRQEGMERTQALLTAGPVRLRPIIMTTLATSLGLLPLALGIGEGGESQAPLATVVIGGLLFSTLLTLVVIPVVYSLLDDMVAKMKKWLRIRKPLNPAETAHIDA